MDSSSGAPIPVFVAAGPATAAGFLITALSTDGRVAAASLVVADEREDARQLAYLTETVPAARIVFLAESGAQPTPGEVAALAPERWRRVERDRLLQDPPGELRALCRFLGLQYDQALLGPVEAVRRAELARAGEEPNSPFASVSTNTFGELLKRTGSSLLISTYQTHRLVCARRGEDALNTHFRTFEKPMGIAVAPGRIALGTRTEIWDFRNMPEAAAKVEPPGSHDACYLPRGRHVTGDIAVHELAFVDGELWLCATGFSCLATLDESHSFVPRWAPRFITRLAPEDRSHLNGMAVRNGRVAQVTALASTDEPGGWRPHKADGGILIDTATSEVAIAGLSMPHSPRWYDGRLWLLESGTGSLCVADLDRGSVEVVAELPGFTRGLAFIGAVAFVGLSQIRESSTFGDLPVTRRLTERQCGVWMVDLGSGQIVGFLRFEDLVQEIFDVAVLPGIRYPEIAEPMGETTSRSYALP